MRLTQQPQLADTPHDPRLMHVVQMMWQQLARVLNANLTFGSAAGAPDNMKGAWYDATSPVGANTEFTVQHNLGYVPQGWLTMYKDKACSVYKGTTAWTTTQIFLKCDTASVHLRLFVIG